MIVKFDSMVLSQCAHFMIPDKLYVARNLGAIEIHSSNWDGMIVVVVGVVGVVASCTVGFASAVFAATAAWNKVTIQSIVLASIDKST